MFSDNELFVIWFALLMEQAQQEEGTDRWWKYERMIRRIEEKLGATDRPKLTVVKTDE